MNIIAKIIDVAILNGISILFLDADTPVADWNRFVIDGIEYAPIPVYDMKRTIAVKGGKFTRGQKVKFIYDNQPI